MDGTLLRLGFMNSEQNEICTICYCTSVHKTSLLYKCIQNCVQSLNKLKVDI